MSAFLEVYFVNCYGLDPIKHIVLVHKHHPAVRDPDLAIGPIDFFLRRRYHGIVTCLGGMEKGAPITCCTPFIILNNRDHRARLADFLSEYVRARTAPGG